MSEPRHFTLDVFVIDGILYGNLMQLEVAMRDAADEWDEKDRHDGAFALRSWADTLGEQYGMVPPA